MGMDCMGRIWNISLPSCLRYIEWSVSYSLKEYSWVIKIFIVFDQTATNPIPFPVSLLSVTVLSHAENIIAAAEKKKYFRLLRSPSWMCPGSVSLFSLWCVEIKSQYTARTMGHDNIALISDSSKSWCHYSVLAWLFKVHKFITTWISLSRLVMKDLWDFSD